MHLVHGLDVGGLQFVVKRLVEGLDPAKFQITVCCYDHCGMLAEAIERAGAEVLLLPRRPGIDWRYPFRLWPILRRRKIDLLHVHNHLAFVYGVPAAKLARTRGLVYTEHGRVLPTSRRFTLANRVLSKLSVHAVPVSEALRGDLQRVEHFRFDKMTVIPNGVPLFQAPDETTRRRLRREMRADNGELLIGTAGRLAEVKDHVGLIRMMPELIQIQPKVRLAIVGQGPLRDVLQDEIRRLDLARFVVLPGETAQIGPYLHAFDLFVLTSKSEGMPLALLEAMGAGKASVSMNVGGVGEAVKDGAEGLLVPPGDYGQFVSKLRWLMDHPAESRAMAMRARQTVRSRFTIERMVAAYADLYARVLKRPDLVIA
jgi:glycosyltransferase involved in cell wall biosynthesis